MRQINLIGGFYRDEPWTAEDVVNWLPESDDSGQARSEAILRGVPGLRTLTFEQGSGGGGGGGSGGGGIVVSGVVVSGAAPVGVRGAAYSFTFTATGGTGPYLWRLSASVPPGLSINPTTGELSGTPTVAGSYPFVVIAEDSEGLPGSLFVSLAVSGPLGVPAPINNPEFTTASDWTEFQEAATPGFSIEAGAGRTNPGYLKWEATAGLSNTYFGDVIYNSRVVEATGNPVRAEIWARCTAITITDPITSAPAAAQLGIQIFEDAACTVRLGPPMEYTSGAGFAEAETDPTRWRLLTLNITPVAGTFYRLAITCGTSVPITLEFDDATWDAREPL